MTERKKENKVKTVKTYQEARYSFEDWHEADNHRFTVGNWDVGIQTPVV